MLNNIAPQEKEQQTVPTRQEQHNKGRTKQMSRQLTI